MFNVKFDYGNGDVSTKFFPSKERIEEVVSVFMHHKLSYGFDCNLYYNLNDKDTTFINHNFERFLKCVSHFNKSYDKCKITVYSSDNGKVIAK